MPCILVGVPWCLQFIYSIITQWYNCSASPTIILTLKDKLNECFHAGQNVAPCMYHQPKTYFRHEFLWQSYTFLFLWQTLTSSTSTDTELSSFSEFCNGFSDTLNNKPASLSDQRTIFVYADESVHKPKVSLPVLWKNPVKVSCRFDAMLQDNAGVKTSAVMFRKGASEINLDQEHLTCEIPDPLSTFLLCIAGYSS